MTNPLLRPTPPGPVVGAFLLYLVHVAVSVLSFVLVLARDPREGLRVDPGSLQSDEISSLPDSTVRTVVVIGLLVLLYLLFLFFVFMMRAGRNWARVVLTVLSALGVAGATSGNGHLTGQWQGWAAWVGVALSVPAIVLMYVTPSNLYFHRAQQFRARPRS